MIEIATIVMFKEIQNVNQMNATPPFFLVQKTCPFGGFAHVSSVSYFICFTSNTKELHLYLSWRYSSVFASTLYQRGSRAEWLEEQVVVWMNKTDVTCQNSTMHYSMQGKRNNRKRHSMKWIKLGSMPKHTCLVPNTGALGENGWLDGMVERLEGILIAPCYWLFCALCMFWFWISVCSVIESGWKVSWPKGSQSKLMEY